MITEFLIFSSILISIFWYSLDRPTKGGKKLPGPFSLPIIGSAIEILKTQKTRNYEILDSLCKKYGPLFGFRVGFMHFVVVQDFDTAKQIMSMDSWSNRGPPKDFLFERTFNKNYGLVWSHGQSWKEIRRYTIRTLKNFGFGKGATMDTFLEQEVTSFFEYFDKLRESNSNIIYSKYLFAISSINTFWGSIAGVRFSQQDTEFRELIKAAQEMVKAVNAGVSIITSFPLLRFIPELTERDEVLRIHIRLQNLFRKIIKERRAKGTITDPQDFIDAFLKDVDEKKKNFEPTIYTEEQMISVCIDLFFTSMDTTSGTLEFAIIYLITNPRVMDKLRMEIDSVIGRDRLPTLDDRNKMPYTEATMWEILRYSSLNPVAGRSPNEDSVINGYFISKDSMVAILLHSIHFSNTIWKNPQEFYPERFLDENMKVINTEKIIPFGYGQRQCLGLVQAKASVFMFLTSLLQKYNLEKSPLHPSPSYENIVGLIAIAKSFHFKATLRE